MESQRALTDEQIRELTEQLHSRLWLTRRRATSVLKDLDFELLEEPPRVELLLASLIEVELRERALASLGRVFRGLKDQDFVELGPRERRWLRDSLGFATPHLHAEYLTAASRALLRLGDTAAVPHLEHLVRKSTITTLIVREAQGGRAPVEERQVLSFAGTYEEESRMRQVRRAAHVAAARLRALAQKAPPDRGLLRASQEPESERMLRPAGNSDVEPEYLLRPARRDADSPP